jgi:hypothetical protein
MEGPYYDPMVMLALPDQILGNCLEGRWDEMGRAGMTYGETATKANKKAVLSQLMAVSLTSKYSALVVETGANVNHYVQSVSVHQPLKSMHQPMYLRPN